MMDSVEKYNQETNRMDHMRNGGLESPFNQLANLSPEDAGLDDVNGEDRVSSHI